MLEPLCALPDYRSSLSASTFDDGNLSFMVHSASRLVLAEKRARAAFTYTTQHGQEMSPIIENVHPAENEFIGSTLLLMNSISVRKSGVF